eukprot:CAMPEP_0179101374 /NCGR_PEP_ID=MMETSP0796-20121207/46867_1 /TAXON_ID=73915 /ORGANISM="Pyrodinium bahamense, Strain pbaha01" /LENGTH=276 /DNA_ID=CAMNT_0020799223 /DNA_START=75 /DNA_END=905 /DNA_ORIENTATION=-
MVDHGLWLCVLCVLGLLAGSTRALSLDRDDASIETGSSRLIAAESQAQQELSSFVAEAYSLLVSAAKELEHALAYGDSHQAVPPAVHLSGASQANSSAVGMAHAAAASVTKVNALGTGASPVEAKTNSTDRVVPLTRTERLKQQQDVLKNLLSHLKTNIQRYNKDELHGKDEHQRILERLRQRLADDQKALNSSNLSAFQHDILVNRTRAEEASIKYWTRGRALQHDMFHSNLRMAHGLMARVKTVLDAYGQAIQNGKIDSKAAEKLRMVSSSLPH